MTTTRSGLTAATISSKDGRTKIYCMFNPEYYSVKKSNVYDPGQELVKPPKPEFKRYGRSTLTLSKLFFDTYETGQDLIAITNKLWDLMRPTDTSDPNKAKPPEVVFEWSSFHFTAVITDLELKFTLFDKNGTPVRAEVTTISFMQSEDPTDYPHQNPTSGAEEVMKKRRVVQGDRLDLIADEVYGDATLWRRIAEFNAITRPRALRPGQVLTIPPL